MFVKAQALTIALPVSDGPVNFWLVIDNDSTRDFSIGLVYV